MLSTHFGLTQEQNSKFELINQNLKTNALYASSLNTVNIATCDRHRSNKGSQLLICLACWNLLKQVQTRSILMNWFMKRICCFVGKSKQNLFTTTWLKNISTFEAVLISKDCFKLFRLRLGPKIETFLIALQK